MLALKETQNKRRKIRKKKDNKALLSIFCHRIENNNNAESTSNTSPKRGQCNTRLHRPLTTSEETEIGEKLMEQISEQEKDKKKGWGVGGIDREFGVYVLISYSMISTKGNEIRRSDNMLKYSVLSCPWKFVMTSVLLIFNE